MIASTFAYPVSQMSNKRKYRKRIRETAMKLKILNKKSSNLASEFFNTRRGTLESHLISISSIIRSTPCLKHFVHLVVEIRSH